jgi:protein-L-isoaspartate(D-aspartate) O-methyltransferase
VDLHPRVLVGDGADGPGVWGPYDRVHVTCAVNQIPPAWIHQTRPGGTIVAPYQPGFGHGVGLKLTIVDGHTAIGRFAGGAGGQMMRAHRYPVAPDMAQFAHHADDALRTTIRMDPRTIAGASPAARLVISALAPGVRYHLTPADQSMSGEQVLWLVETRSDAMTKGSWARITYRPGRHGYDVEQSGPRRLWDEVHNAYLRWVGWGSPGLDRFGLTVAPSYQSVWLDTPPMKISRRLEEPNG